MVAPPIYRYRRRPPNLLPVDPKTGGLARMMGWVNLYYVMDQGDGFITVHNDDEQIDSGIRSPGGGAPDTFQATVRVTPGLPYTAAVTASPTGGTIYLGWIGASGRAVAPADLATGSTPRISVTAVAPAGAVGAFLTFIQGDSAQLPTTFRDPVFVQSTVDPGPLPPLPDPPLMGDRLYGSLPEMYRTADQTAAGPGQTPLPLYQLLKAIGEQADWPLYYADRMAARELTNPDLADDAWIPWLAQAAGITQSTSTTATADMRAGVAGKGQAAQPGTPAAIVALVRTWLTGTKVCNIVPTSTAWTIAVQVRADEMNGMSAATLKTRILATGLVPAGFTLNISNALPTWDQIDAAFGTTWDAKDKNFPLWQDIDSYGVT